MSLNRFFVFLIIVPVVTIEALLPTYWSYSQNELEKLQQLEVPKQEITQKAIEKWDDVVYQLLSHPLPDALGTRFFAYLYVAQRDAAFLSFNIHQQFLGTLDSITAEVISFCFPDYRLEREIETDPFSKEVARLVFEKVKARFEDEQNHLQLYEPKIGKEYWSAPDPIGQRVGSALTWLIGPVEQFRLPEPPSADSIIWTYGVNQIKEAQAHIGEKEKNIIEYWGSLQGPKSGNWFAIANDYLATLSPPLPLQNFLFIRSIFAMSIADAAIAEFDNKYRFWVLRPHMLDPSVKTFINVPHHPSYPSGHSIISSTAATVLSYFFPNDRLKWRSTAIEAGNSRIAGGLHYMIDNESGLMLGEKVGQKALQQQSLRESHY